MEHVGSLITTLLKRCVWGDAYPDKALLSKAFDVIFAVHVNEEPTIRVTEEWGCRSKLLDDKDNPNRYWNRTDADALHGDVVQPE